MRSSLILLILCLCSIQAFAQELKEEKKSKAKKTSAEIIWPEDLVIVLSHRGDNGADPEEAIKQEALTEEQITYLLTLGSKQLKQKYLEPIVQNVTSALFESLQSRKLWEKMLSDSNYNLLDDVIYSQYEINGYCKSDDGACTGDKPGMTISFNMERLLEMKVSLPHLIGIIMHEHSHHYVGNEDHKDWGILNGIKNLVISERYKGKLFDEVWSNGKKVIAYDKKGDRKSDFSREQLIQIRADLFCKSRQFRAAKDGDYTTLTFNQKTQLSEIRNDLRSYSFQFKKGEYFQTIRCVY